MRNRHFVNGSASLLVLLLTSCGTAPEAAQPAGDAQKVQQRLAAALRHQDVSVSLGYDVLLSIGIVNSPLRDLPAPEKRAKALEIARLAYTSLPSRSSLQTVTVAFIVKRTYFFIFHYTDSSDFYGFDTTILD